MFRQLARELTDLGGLSKIITYHPVELAQYMDIVWSERKARPAHMEPGLTALPGYLYANNSVMKDVLAERKKKAAKKAQEKTGKPREIDAGTLGNEEWAHLIYAYLVENTRVFEVFTKVLREFIHGEKLGHPNLKGTQNWLRITEELFFKDHPFAILSLASSLRPDNGAARRNAYYRMFGMDLNHGKEDNQPYPYMKAQAANQDFVAVFQKFLYEVWQGIKYRKVEIGAKETNNTAIINLALRMRDMFHARRRGGNLGREEFVYVTTMSWFHLALETESEIVTELRAQAPSPHERLTKIGEKVGAPVHQMAENYFRLAEPTSRILLFIEDQPDDLKAETFYDIPGIRNDIEEIITHWSTATGQDLKGIGKGLSK
jgi:hypothetical protein